MFLWVNSALYVLTLLATAQAVKQRVVLRAGRRSAESWQRSSAFNIIYRSVFMGAALCCRVTLKVFGRLIN